MRNVGGGRAAVFAPLEVGRRADAVVRRLSDGIRLGLLSPEEQLPSESDLAEAFGVSPVTVREALTALRGQGLVVTRRGRKGGSFVRPQPAGPADDAAVLREHLRALSPSELRDLADHYAAISGACAQLAAERAGEQDIAMIAETVAALDRATDPGDRRRAEARFHVELAAAAQSPRLTREVIGMQAELGGLLWSQAIAPDSETARRHRALLDAVVRGDGAAARSIATAHLYAALAGASTLQLTFLGEPHGGADQHIDPVAAVVERVGRVCESAFAAVEGLRGAADQLVRPWAEGGSLSAADVEPISRVVRPLLTAPGTPLTGAGLVMAPGVLDDATHWLEWWHHTADGADIERLTPELDAAAPGFYDYSTLPWFAIPRATGARYVTGPYVDYLCTHDYTLTFTAPLIVVHPEHGRVCAGVVGADILTGWIERTLLPLLGAIARPTALVNAEGRIAVANDPSLVVGEVVHGVDVPALWAGGTDPTARLYRLDRMPLGVLVR